jgi:hypothetical protein
MRKAIGVPMGKQVDQSQKKRHSFSRAFGCWMWFDLTHRFAFRRELSGLS